MDKVFYLFAFVFIAFEVYQFVNVREILDDTEKMMKVDEEIRRTGRLQGNEFTTRFAKVYLLDMLYVCWSCLGLLSSQWVFFVCLFLLTLLSTEIKKRTLKDIGFSDAVKFDRSNSIFSIVLLAVIVGNKLFSWFAVPRSILEVLGVWS